MPNTTNGNHEGRNNEYSEDVVILAFVGILATLLQVKSQNKSESPFETHFPLKLPFLAALFLYFLSLLARKKLVDAHQNFAMIIKSYVRLFGILLNFLLLLMLEPTLGQIFLSIWLFCFVVVTCVLFAKIIAPTSSTGDTNGGLNEDNSAASSQV